MRPGFSVGIVGVIAVLARGSQAGTVVGRLELPASPERGPVVAKGFLDRTENPFAEIRKLNIAPYFVVALEGPARSDSAPADVTWDLVGESFARPVIAVPVGAEVVIKNVSKIARTLVADEDPLTAEDVEHIHAALDELVAEHRDVLVLRYVENMTYEEIARVAVCDVGVDHNAFLVIGAHR
jgi:hypothetical protein